MFRNFSSLVLIVLSATICFASAGREGTLSGKWITKEQGPMSGAMVLLFSTAGGPAPSSDKYLRVPTVTALIDDDGRFSIKVPAGSYYLVMRKHTDGITFGPPQDGDLQYYSRDKKGNPRIFAVKGGQKMDIGTIREAVVFERKQPQYAKGMTAIEGTVTDGNGAPIEGERVLVYSSPEMKGKPLYASDGTGKDGKYFVNVVNKGIYYLKARSHYGGGQPEAGEQMGGYGEPTAPAIVSVKKGELKKGINIKVDLFPGRGKQE